MTRIYSLAVFVSAALVFAVQPLVGKILLPEMGGSPAVWSVCMVFFQTVLLAGYLYAHLITTRLSARSQGIVHSCVLAVAALALPLTVEVGAPAIAEPRAWLLATLATKIGLPFFALSATAPLVIRWFADGNHAESADPYFLYAASNAGSLLGLGGYLALEPLATRSSQAFGWSLAFWSLAAVLIVCVVSRRRAGISATAKRRQGLKPLASTNARQRSKPALWIALSLLPSALLVGVTQHLATDVVSVPLLWVVPLAMYLVTYVAAFSRRGAGSEKAWNAIALALVVGVVALSLAEIRYPVLPIAIAHLALFFALSMRCHVEFASLRPVTSRLTTFFLCVALGGALGSAAASLVAPSIFSAILEYPLAIGAALLIQSGAGARPRARWIRTVAVAICFFGAYWLLSAFDRSTGAGDVTANVFATWTSSLSGDPESGRRLARLSFALPIALLMLFRRSVPLAIGLVSGLLVVTATTRTGGDVLVRERTFFGVHQVTSVQNGDWHELTHGTTTHGVQATRGKVHDLPTAYYHPSGPIGDVVFTLSPEGRLRNMAVVGLGAGALAAYAGPGVQLDFFEIDEAVIRIAENPSYFTYLADARRRQGTTVTVSPVDGRIGLTTRPDSSYDLIVVDAFSSDAIPSHLLTREAVGIYMGKLRPTGLVAFHVSNRFFDLKPVLASIAENRRLVAFARDDLAIPPERAAEAMRASTWVVLGRDEASFGQLAHAAPRWTRLSAEPVRSVWTDDYTNIFGALAD